MAGILYAPMNSPLIHTFRKRIRRVDIAPVLPNWCTCGIEWDSHCTMYYGLTKQDGAPETKEAVPAIEDFIRSFVAGTELVFVPHQCAVFEAPGWDCIVVKAHKGPLNTFHAAFQDKFNYKGSEYEYTPHVTLGYVKKGLGKKYADDFNTGYAGHRAMRADNIIVELEDGFKHNEAL